MQQDWIFDVLADLRVFAQDNGMPALAAQIDIALRVARQELPTLAERIAADDVAPPSAKH